MAFDAAFYNQTQELQSQMAQAAQALAAMAATKPAPTTPPPLLQLRRGLAESPAWLLVQAAEFEPEPISVERLRVRAIWSSERIITAILELMATEKWLERIGEDYYLLPEGQRLKTELAERWKRLFLHLTPALQQTDVARFEHLFARIIDNALHSPTPPGNWCLQYSRRRAPAFGESAVLKIFHYFSDLNAFRDDAHLAAWRPYGVAGFVWEAFNFIYNGTAANADEIFDQISYRGYSRQEYVAALQELIELGWLRANSERFQVTDKGRLIFAEVEERTNEYFYAPFQQLGVVDLQEFRQLFDQFSRELQSLQESQPTP